MDHLKDRMGPVTHSVCQCKFDGDCEEDGDGDGMCKQTLISQAPDTK